MESYRKEWFQVKRPCHQLKRLRKTDRPREKLLAFGPSKLTPSELLAIFLRTGVKGKSVIKIASELLTQFGGVKGIFEADKKDLLKVEGFGEAKVAQIKAIHGLAEEYLKEKAKLAPIMKKSKEVFDYLYLSMRDLKQETFKVIFLDSANQVIDMKKLYDAGWRDDQINEQKYFTDGRIVVVGRRHHRKPGKKADYLLRYHPDYSIAVIEAKPAYKNPGDGFQQAMEYAEILNLKFAYATNGHGIIEHDYTTGKQTQLNEFPTPDELWRRLREYEGIDSKVAERFLFPYNRDTRNPGAFHPKDERLKS